MKIDLHNMTLRITFLAIALIGEMVIGDGNDIQFLGTLLSLFSK
jgi:hypothetical protein